MPSFASASSGPSMRVSWNWNSGWPTASWRPSRATPVRPGWLTFQQWPLDRLPQSFVHGGWAETASTEAVVAEFRRRRIRLSGQALAALTKELEGVFERLAPVRQRLAFLDEIAELIVRRLYGIHG